MDAEPGWNMVFFLAFSLAAGMILRWSGADLTRLRTWIYFISLFLCSLIGGILIKRDTGQAAGVLFISTFLYMIGWILLAFIQLPYPVGIIWTILGLALFTFIAMALISQGKVQDREGGVIPLSIQLFVVLFNLCWLSSLL